MLSPPIRQGGLHGETLVTMNGAKEWMAYSFLLPLGGRLRCYMDPLFHGIGRVDDNYVAILEPGCHIDLRAKITSNVNVLHMHHAIFDNGYELTLRKRKNAIARNKNPWICSIEVKLYG